MLKGFLKTINIIFFALLAGQVVFISIALYIVNSSPPIETENDLFNIIVPVVVGSGLFISNLIFKKLLEKINNDAKLESKLAIYQKASVLKFALLEGPSIFATVVYIISGNLMFLGFSVVMILAFLMNIPTRNRLINDLNLNSNEADNL